jgi:hypothetical protein
MKIPKASEWAIRIRHDHGDNHTNPNTMGHNRLHTRHHLRLRKRDAYGNKFDKAELDDTFWHELTHTHTTRHEARAMTDNEKFVNAFANRLTQAVNSAKL